MTSSIYRGEISQIIDEVFISYSLELPEEELASTSGYFMKSSPFRYSYFTIQRGADSPSQQTTEVYEVDHTNGNKTSNRLAALTWSSGGSKSVCLGLITGYALPKEWEAHVAEPYFSCYISVASVRKPGIGRNQDEQLDLHSSRIQTLSDAVLRIYVPTLPEGIDVNALKLFMNSHNTQEGVHHQPLGAVAPPPSFEAAFDPKINCMVIGGPGQLLQTGLYVVAKPIGPGDSAHIHATQQPVYDHHA